MTNDKSYDRLDDIANILGRIYSDIASGNGYNKDKSPKINIVNVDKAMSNAEHIAKLAAREIIFAAKNRVSNSKKESENISHSQWRTSNGASNEKKEETVASEINTDKEAVRILKKIESFMDDDEDFRDGEEYLWLVDRYIQLGNKDVRVKDTDR